MDIATQLKNWIKLCLRKKLTPICLVTFDEEGFPQVLTKYDDKLLREVFTHLSQSEPNDSKLYLEDQEN